MTVFKLWIAFIWSQILSTHSEWPLVCAINIWNPDLFSLNQNYASNLISILLHSDSFLNLLIKAIFAIKLKFFLELWIEHLRHSIFMLWFPRFYLSLLFSNSHLQPAPNNYVVFDWHFDRKWVTTKMVQGVLL